jgi:carbonic anhydrase/acetyltransferase-like protein (isoleucine patch superfamily)
VICKEQEVLEMPVTERKVRIHETADIDPSVILRGEITIGAWTRIGPGTVLTGNITIGHHTLIQCNVVLRGRVQVGNYVHIYDSVCIEQGRPAEKGSSTATEPDQSIIGDEAWINHGATMHGSQIGEGGIVGLNACLDYNTRVGKGAVVANGSATRVGTIVPDNALFEGVPAKLAKENLTDEDLKALMGLLPREWVHYAGAQQEEVIREKKGLTPESET